MQFCSVSLADAVGHILGHNVTGRDGRRVLRKGRMVTAADVVVLQELGRSTLYVAQLAPTDIPEDVAARQITAAVCGDHLRRSKGATGRVNIYADTLGLVRADVEQLFALNRLAGVTLATLPSNTAVDAGKMVATLKIIPYAISADILQAALHHTALLTFTPLPKRNVGLILSGYPTVKERVIRSFEKALRPRLAALNATLAAINFVPLEDETDEQLMATALSDYANQYDLVILAGETAIQDRYDIAPRAIERMGGEIELFGAPVDPGNLLLLAYAGNIPIVGAPGCARSPKDNIVDIILPRLLAGDHLTQDAMIEYAHGGLLEDVPERPLPRSRIESGTKATGLERAS